MTAAHHFCVPSINFSSCRRSRRLSAGLALRSGVEHAENSRPVYGDTESYGRVFCFLSQRKLGSQAQGPSRTEVTRVTLWLEPEPGAQSEVLSFSSALLRLPVSQSEAQPNPGEPLTLDSGLHLRQRNISHTIRRNVGSKRSSIRVRPLNISLSMKHETKEQFHVY